MKTLISKNTLIVIAAIIVALGAYWYFFTGTSNAPPLTTSSTPENPAQTQFRALVSKLQPITFNTTIFSDARFNALVDLATPIAPEATGRPDPFAVIAGVVGR